MRFAWVIIFCLGLLVVLAASAGAYTIVFEGANYTWIKPSMQVIEDDGGVNGHCVYVPLRPNHSQTEQPPTDDGNITIKGWAPVDGTYYIWARTKWYDGCGKSFYLFVDDMNPDVPPYIGGDGTYQKWHWVQAKKTYQLTKGWHNFRFQNREDGVRLDEFLITTASPDDWVPDGIMTPTQGYVWKQPNS
jgi:hypothetical protein